MLFNGMKRLVILILIFVAGLTAGDQPIALSPAAEKQLSDLGLSVEKLAHRTDHKLISYIRLVVALRNTSARTYDRVAVTMAVLDGDRNETGISQTVELRDLMPGRVSEVVARAQSKHASVVSKN